MNRRNLLRGTVALGAALAGCTGSGSDEDGSPTVGDDPGTTPTTTRETPTPTPTPEKPASLDGENVVEYVRSEEHERVRELLTSGEREDASLDCKAFLHRQTTDGYVVLAGCGGSASGGGSHADRGGRPAFYYVNDERTVRVSDPRQVDRPEDDAYAGESDENVDRAAGIRLYNFLDASQSLTVRAVHQNSGETAYEAVHELDGESGAVVGNVARRRGSYAVTVEAGDASATGGWTVTEETVGGAILTGTLAPGPDLGVGIARIREITALGPV